MSTPPRRVAIVGGGLAGMAAAAALHSARVSVTLFESRKSLGGRAGSFEDPQTGEILDNCQHVLLACCTNLIDFYRRIGAQDLIHWEDHIRFVDARGRMYALSATEDWPAPLHLALSAASFSALSVSERIALSLAMRAMLRLGTKGRAELADVSFGVWLQSQKQPRSLIEKFYNLVLISALNEQCERASAADAIQVFQKGMLFNRDAYRMGTPACPLGELYAKFSCGEVRLGRRVAGVKYEGNRAVGVECGDETLGAEAVILAVNHPALDKLVPEALSKTDSRFSRLGELESVPILGAHLWFDRPVLETPHAALIGGQMQWLFRKPEGDGSAVHGVISAARDWLRKSKEECLDIFTREARRYFPKARNARLRRGVIVIEKRATFSPLPSLDRIRPPQGPPSGGIENLFLAGDYTRTGWPATMEGAVRAGYLAAEAVLQTPGKFLMPAQEVEWPARWLRF